MKCSILRTTVLCGFILANCCIYAAENIYFNESKSTTEPTRYLKATTGMLMKEERSSLPELSGTTITAYSTPKMALAQRF